MFLITSEMAESMRPLLSSGMTQMLMYGAIAMAIHPMRRNTTRNRNDLAGQFAPSPGYVIDCAMATCFFFSFGYYRIAYCAALEITSSVKYISI